MSRAGGPSTSEGQRRGSAPGGERFFRVEDVRGDLLAEVRVEADRDHTVGDLVAAVAAGLRWPSPPKGAQIRRRRGSADGWLAAAELLLASDLLTGDTLILEAVSHNGTEAPAGSHYLGLSGPTTPTAGSPGLETPRPAAEFDLVVASGPDAGRRAPLLPGRHLIGRDPGGLLVLSDPTVSRYHAVLDVSRDSVRLTPFRPTGAGPGPGSDPHAELGADADLRPGQALGSGSGAPTGRARPSLWVDGEAVTEVPRWRPGQLARLGSTTVVLRRPVRVQTLVTDRTGLVPFQRTPYFHEPVAPVTIPAFREIPAKPEAAQPAYIAAVAPLLMGVGMAVIFGQPRFLLFAMLSPMMIIGSFLDQRRRNAKRYAAGLARFEAELADRAAEVGQALSDERRRRLLSAPDIAELGDRVEARSADLWVRGRAAADFLRLRVGLGELTSCVTTQRPEGAEPEIRDLIDEAFGHTDTLADVPVTVDLLDVGTLGVAGRMADTTMLANSLVAQACALHSPEDLVLAVAADPSRELHRWMHWLPHTRSASSPLSGTHLAWSTDAGEELLTEILSTTTETSTDSGPHLLVVIDHRLHLDPTLVARFLDVSSEAPVSVVWLAGGAAEVPRQANALVTVRPLGAGQISRLDHTDGERASTDLEPERLSADAAGTLARSLAPVRDASSAGAATALPRVAPLFDALGLGSSSAASTAQQIVSAWQPHLDRSATSLRLLAPIGVTESGPLVLDLVAHGPHALIGGTSGSGKSELLMSLVAGLIAWQPPSRVNLLFIDYKGGASSDVFRPAPHTVGYVTNLDGDRARRALVSLRAELDRRMQLLQGRAKDLSEMVARCPAEAPPALVIVVDEFATLVSEIPDFVAGIVDVAQRGRSLGIHLVLATQRPSGSIDDNIKANTNLRIALRMLDAGESNAVIGVPDAAGIPNPLRGRGYVSFGAGGLVAFQSAWSGAPRPGVGDSTGPTPIRVGPWSGMEPTIAAERTPEASESADKGESSEDGTQRDGTGSTDGDSRSQTQLDVLLDGVSQATAALGLRPGLAPWLEELADEIPLVTVLAERPDDGSAPNAPGRQVTIGMVDDPERQRQYPAVLDLAAGGTLVIGGAGSGKSTLLRTLAISAALDDNAWHRSGAADLVTADSDAAAPPGRAARPGAFELSSSSLAIFAFDFASRQLVGLKRLPHCAGVATGDDIEALTRYLDVLDGELERRRSRLAEAIASGSPVPDEPSILLLIDGYEVLVGLLEQSPAASGLADYGPRLARLLTEGRSVGILPVLTVPRAGAVRAQVASALSNRVVLRQADPQGYSEAGIPTAQARELDLQPGQAILQGATRVQIALTSDREQAAVLDSPVTWPGLADSLVTKPLPQKLGLLRQNPNTARQNLQDALRPVVGQVDLTGEPLALDLRRDNLLIVGEPRSGRSTAAATIARQAAVAGAEVWLLAPPWSPLADLRLSPASADQSIRRCVTEGPERIATLTTWSEELRGRRAGDTDGPPRLLVVDDADLLGNADPQAAALLERLLATVRWVSVSSTPRGFDPSPVAQALKQARSLVYLQPTDRRDAHEVLGFNPPWHPGLAMPPGRGLVVVDRRAALAQFSVVDV